MVTNPMEKRRAGQRNRNHWGCRVEEEEGGGVPQGSPLGLGQEAYQSHLVVIISLPWHLQQA